MHATQTFYVVICLLTVVPLILFNIPKIFEKKPPAPMKIHWIRAVVIVGISALIITFSATAYNATLNERYEIALENAATHHAKVLTEDADWEDYKAFLVAHGTETVAASFDEMQLDDAGCAESVSFQLSSWCIPKYWQEEEGFEKATIIDGENPVYVMYLLDYNGKQQYYAIRMVNTEDGWRYDWIGNATEQQQKIIKMPTQKNGKWYTVG